MSSFNNFFTICILMILICGQMAIFAQDQDLELKLYLDRAEEKPSRTAKSQANIERVGAWAYGTALAVDVDPQRDLIFLGSGGVVLILDGSDVTNPVMISDSIHTHGLVEDIRYDSLNQRLFLACGEGGMEIWDVQNPINPQFLSRKEVLYFDFETPVGGVDIYQNFAFAECAWGGAHSLDVSDPMNPVQISFSLQMGNPAHNIHVSQEDGQLHSTGAQYYQRFVIQSNGQLNSSGSREFIYGAGEVYGKHEVAYVGYGGYMYILDLFAPGFLPWSITDVGGISEITVPGDTAYIVNNTGFHVYDVSTHNNPIYVGSLNETYYSANLAVAEGYAYITESQYGLRIIDIGDGTQPVEVGSFEVLGVTWQAQISGSYAFTAHSKDGMIIVDVSNPARPTEVSQFDTPGEAREVFVQGNHAYIADDTGGLRIADVTTPQTPMEIGVWDSVDVWRVAPEGQVAYIIEAIPNDPYWLRILDISNLSNPVEMGSLELPGRAHKVVARIDTLFIAADDAGLLVIDASDPNNPVEIGSYVAPDVYDVFIRDQYAFVAAAGPFGGLIILDISDPTAPALSGQYSDPGFRPFHVYVEGDYAYLDEVNDDLHMFYIADPTSPMLLEEYRLPDFTANIFAVDSLIYFSDARAGLQILKNKLFMDPGGGLSWQLQNSGTSEILNSVNFVDKNTGWVAGDQGTILHTTNGGDTWQPQTSGTSADLSGIVFLDSQTGYAVGTGGTILKTSDAGTSWNMQILSVPATLNDVHFVSPDTGWAVGENGTIAMTNDGGSNWQMQSSPVTDELYSLHFVDGDNGWITVGDFGTTLRTTDGGANWQKDSIPTSNLLNDIYFVNDQVGWTVGWFGAIYKSVDGGINWTQQNNPHPPDWLYSVHFVDENTGWAVGFDGKVIHTNDGGQNWITQLSGTQSQLNAVYFVDEDNGWAVGRDGTVIKTMTPVGIPGQKDFDGTIPVSAELHQNYPNPFNPETTIKYSLPAQSKVTLKIYNILGEEIRTLVDEVQTLGAKTVSWDGRDNHGKQVSSGIYIYSLKTSKTVLSKKMFLIR